MINVAIKDIINISVIYNYIAHEFILIRPI